MFGLQPFDRSDSVIFTLDVIRNSSSHNLIYDISNLAEAAWFFKTCLYIFGVALRFYVDI